jgi:osmoprotectant transport system permease protein
MKERLLGMILCCLSGLSFANSEPIRIGSKIFTEGYVLAEILAQHLEAQGLAVKRLGGLGATGITEQAMKSGEMDLVVDYTGSISQAFLGHSKKLAFQDLQQKLKPFGFIMGRPLGFNNTYGIAVRKEWIDEYKIHKLSQLTEWLKDKSDKKIKAAFTPEFTNRPENWPQLKNFYALENIQVLQMDHQLAYESLAHLKVDLMEAYTTDAKLKHYKLKVLDDDQKFFPRFDAVILANAKWVKKNAETWAHLQKLEGLFSDEVMTELNGQADLEKKSIASIARNFLSEKFKKNLPEAPSRISSIQRFLNELIPAFVRHLILVIVPCFLASLVAIPLAYFSLKFLRFAHVFASLATLAQTIPGLALLALLIPFLGIGLLPALTTLFLFALLPLYLSTLNGFRSLPQTLHLTCQTLDIKGWFKFRIVEWPMVKPSFLSGLETALISTVASATLAALIGAGGLGQKIIAGLALNDHQTILEGAVPASLLALLIQFFFSWMRKAR